VLVETVFGFDLGRLVFESLLRRDLRLCCSASFVSSVVVMLANLAADLTYGASARASCVMNSAIGSPAALARTAPWAGCSCCCSSRWWRSSAVDLPGGSVRHGRASFCRGDIRSAAACQGRDLAGVIRGAGVTDHQRRRLATVVGVASAPSPATAWVDRRPHGAPPSSS
jgi:hypothetical protein